MMYADSVRTGIRPVRRSGFAAACLLGCAGLVLAPGSSGADEVAAFYSGKTINLVIGYSAGGGYDVYARTVARHMGRNIPGNPGFVVQNMPGAGSRTAANWLFNIAPQDGTALGSIGQNTPLDQALKQSGVQFDAARFQWIGSPIVTNNMIMAWHTAEVKSVEDLLAGKPLVCGGTGATSPSILNPQIMNNLLGTRIRIISGYPGGSDVNLAMERGEVECRGSHNWASVKGTLPQWLEERRVNIIVQDGLTQDPEINAYQGREVPLFTDLAKNETDRRALAMLSSGVVMGRPLVAPPDVPSARITALRAAFDATMSDSRFLEDATRQNLDLAPLSGNELQTVARDTVSAPEAVVQRALELIERRDIEALTP